MKPELKLGEIYKITFLDHCHGTGSLSDPISFDVVGKLIEIKDKSIKLASWIYTNKSAEIDDNVEVFIVVTSTIEKIKRLR